MLRLAPTSDQALLIFTDADVASLPPATRQALTKLCDYAYLAGVGGMWVNSVALGAPRTADFPTDLKRSRRGDASRKARRTNGIADGVALILLAASAYLRERGVRQIVTLYALSRPLSTPLPSVAEAQASLLARFARLCAPPDASPEEYIKRLLSITATMRAATDMLRSVAYLAPSSPGSRLALAPTDATAIHETRAADADDHQRSTTGGGGAYQGVMFGEPVARASPSAPFGVAAPTADDDPEEVWRVVRALYHWLMRSSPITPIAIRSDPASALGANAAGRVAYSTSDHTRAARREHIAALIDQHAATASLRVALRRSQQALNEQWAALRADLLIEDAYTAARTGAPQWGADYGDDATLHAMWPATDAYVGDQLADDAFSLAGHASEDAAAANGVDLYSTLRQARECWPQLDARAKQRWLAAWSQALPIGRTESSG